jgi:amino acid permease
MPNGKVGQVFMDYVVGYGLSDKRRAAAIRQWKIRVFISLFLVVLALTIWAMVPSGSASTAVVYGAAACFAIIWIPYAFMKRETSWQLWSRERRAIQDNHRQNQQELDEFAARTVNEENDNGRKSAET